MQNTILQKRGSFLSRLPSNTRAGAQPTALLTSHIHSALPATLVLTHILALRLGRRRRRRLTLLPALLTLHVTVFVFITRLLVPPARPSCCVPVPLSSGGAGGGGASPPPAARRARRRCGGQDDGWGRRLQAATGNCCNRCRCADGRWWRQGRAGAGVHGGGGMGWCVFCVWWRLRFLLT